MKPSAKRKREASDVESDSPKRSKVHAQRKFAQGAGVVSPAVSPIRERDRSRNAHRNVAPPAEPVKQSCVPKTIDFLTFLCFQRTALLPPNLNYLRETSVMSSIPSNNSNVPQQAPRQSAKKSDKSDDAKKQSTGVQALRKKYHEQRIAKQKATNVTTLAKKVKGKNMVRSTRSSAVRKDVKNAKVVDEVKRGNTNVQSSLKRPPGRPPGSAKAKIVKLSKRKLLRVGLRSGGSIKEPQSTPKQQAPIKPKKQEETSKVSPRLGPATPTSTPVKVVKLKKSRAEREIGSDFSSDDNEPLLAHKPPQRQLSRRLESQQKTVAKVRPVRRTKAAATAYMEVLTRKLASPPGDDEQSLEDFPVPPQTRRLEKREELPSTSKKTSEKTKLPQVAPPKKSSAKTVETPRVKKKVAEVVIRPSTRSQAAKTVVAVKKQVLKSLIQKKKMHSLRTLTRLSNSKRLAQARKAFKPVEGKSATPVAEKQTNESKKEKESEPSSRKLRLKTTEIASSSSKSHISTEQKNQTVENKCKGKVREKPAKKANQIEVGLGGLSKRPVRKCSTIDKIWIDVDGFTSDEDDFIDIDSLTDGKTTVGKSEEKSGPLLLKPGGKGQTEDVGTIKKLEPSKDLETQMKAGCSKNEPFVTNAVASHQDEVIDPSSVKARITKGKDGKTSNKVSEVREDSKAGKNSSRKSNANSDQGVNQNIVNIRSPVPKKAEKDLTKFAKTHKPATCSVKKSKLTKNTKGSSADPSVTKSIIESDSPFHGFSSSVTSSFISEDSGTKVLNEHVASKNKTSADLEPISRVGKGVGTTCDNLKYKTSVSEHTQSIATSPLTVPLVPNETRNIVLPTTKANVVPAAVSPSPSVAPINKLGKIECSVVPLPAIAKEPITMSTNAPVSMPNSSTCSNVPDESNRAISPPESKIEESHSLIAKLAATVTMTSQSVIAKAIKDLKVTSGSVPFGEIKEEEHFLKGELSFKAEEHKPGMGLDDKKNILPLCNTSTPLYDMKYHGKDSLVPQLRADTTGVKMEMNNHIKGTESVKLADGQHQANAAVCSYQASKGLRDLDESAKQAKQGSDMSASDHQETIGGLPQPNASITELAVKLSGKEDNKSSGTSSKRGSKQKNGDVQQSSAPETEGSNGQTKTLKVDDKKGTPGKKKKPSSAGKIGRRKTARSTHSPSTDTARKERPKRQCSNIARSWIERDSDDSSFYQSGDEDFVELIRQSELAERRQQQKAKRRSWKSSSRNEKECDNFSDSDDEPLKKKSTSSVSVASVSTRETTTLPQPGEESVSIPKNSPGKSEAPQERNIRAGASGLVEVPPTTVTFVPPPMREPINTHGLDLLSEVVTCGNFGSPDKSTARIEQWLNENLRADNASKAFLGFDENDMRRPAAPAEDALHVATASKEQPKTKLIESPEMQMKKINTKIHEQASTFRRKPVASVQELLKLQKERRVSPKPLPEQHSKNCQCNSCVVKKAWFKNKPVPDESNKSSRESSPAKPFQFLSSTFPGPNNAKSSPDGKASASVAPIVLNKDSKTVGTQRKLSFLERMRERERKPSACAFSANNESSVYAFEPEPPERKTAPNVMPFRSRTMSSRTTSDDTDEDRSRHQSTSIAVQTNFEDMETQTPDVGISVADDGRSNEISTQTDGGDENPDSAMFYIPIEESAASQPRIQGVTVKLGAEGPMGPNRLVVMKAEIVTTPNIKALVTPVQKLEGQKNALPVGTVQPTSRSPAVPATASSLCIRTEDDKRTPARAHKTAETEDIPLSAQQSKTEDKSSPILSKPSASLQKGASTPVLPSEQLGKLPVRSPKPSCSSDGDGNNVLAGVVEAPTFHLTEKEFQDPLEFFERIRPAAERFGICRIVPPSSFKPDCKVADDMRFTAYNQFVHRMLHRWGPNTRETMAMKKYLKTQRISLKPPPCVGGMEVDLPRLFKAVQTCGGLMKVMDKQKWQHVADMLRIPKAAHDRGTKLDTIYCQYLLPYDTLTPEERENLLTEVSTDWAAYENKIDEEPSDEDEEEEENYIEECEECIVKGRNMALSQFYRIARNTMSMWFKSPEPSPSEVEEEFWRQVTERTNHICVHSGSIDSSGWGYGFPVGKNNFAKHPWNLKVLTNNHDSVLRSLGPVMGVTVPTLHVGMVFAAFCWYRDPHGLPWIEYLHTGAPKIWYGISDDNSEHLREALTKLLPHHIRNQRIWLPCDTAMAPPDRLAELGVPLSRTTQEPGQFVLVFPRAFTSSLCTGYLVSESVYFALPSWLQTAEQVFKDIHDSAESSAFSLDNLLFSIAGDSRASLDVLQQVLPMVKKVRDRELEHRTALQDLGLKSEMLPRETKSKRGRSTEPEAEHECDVCRASLFLSLVSITAEESVFCLAHGLQQLKEHPDQLPGAKHLYHFDEDEVKQVYTKLEEKIGTKLLKNSKK